ncbi:hypothetical protein [Paraburkholderia sp. J41]|uniref:hypothetical protein n=1 Tax=Paraburkholderia sp. J41 TaxID=2805433 RepID=UPI002AC366AF|nr:hypothetical protein [Paraburkholderia sp. J41]
MSRSIELRRARPNGERVVERTAILSTLRNCAALFYAMFSRFAFVPCFRASLSCLVFVLRFRVSLRAAP